MKIVVVVVVIGSRGCLVRVLVENIGCTKLFFMLMNKKKKREKNIKSMTVKKEDKNKTKTQHARQKICENKNSWSRQVFLGKKLAIFM